MKARIAILIALLIFGGIGADWWMEELTSDPTEAADVTKKDGGEPPPSPQP